MRSDKTYATMRHLGPSDSGISMMRVYRGDNEIEDGDEYNGDISDHYDREAPGISLNSYDLEELIALLHDATVSEYPDDFTKLMEAAKKKFLK